MTDFAELARLAGHAADAARREVLAAFGKVATIETKADGSPVTATDRAAERAIRDVLRTGSPPIPVFGEEFGPDEELTAGAPQYWLVDPIDGTFSFTRGVPLFGTLIALVRAGVPRLGLIDLPCLDQRVVGWEGAAVLTNGKPVRVSQRRTLSTALVAHGDAELFDLIGARDLLDDLRGECLRCRAYTDAFGYSLVVQGAVDLMVDAWLSPWDAAAVRALVPAAGGTCRGFVGEAGNLAFVAGSPALVEPVAARFAERLEPWSWA